MRDLSRRGGYERSSNSVEEEETDWIRHARKLQEENITNRSVGGEKIANGRSNHEDKDVMSNGKEVIEEPDDLAADGYGERSR